MTAGEAGSAEPAGVRLIRPSGPLHFFVVDHPSSRGMQDPIADVPALEPLRRHQDRRHLAHHDRADAANALYQRFIKEIWYEPERRRRGLAESA